MYKHNNEAIERLGFSSNAYGCHFRPICTNLCSWNLFMRFIAPGIHTTKIVVASSTQNARNGILRLGLYLVVNVMKHLTTDIGIENAEKGYDP